ncbi:ribosome biogenesis GTPase YqeH [Sporosarcina sp. HYO08]|uniref:ribosome biogenesis GTPase YqeH n=1 Tax=Sporosarcina sp. HYO08 TaxID=1759557 RepID=UPI000796D1E8|nr:ribosome biogenesis GTPase YqeH [Sporosarcina sp. HYO08]KXH87377.1 ribosome biogenesis GTPase YqeH [Sporosarcina sp. HYO08]
MEELTCIGCGIAIQTENPKAEGYAPPASLEKEDVICQRCFRLRNYNELQPVSLSGDDFLAILNGIGEKEGIVVKIVDIFDFNGSWINGLQRFVGNKEILLIGNKVDVLPKAVNRNRLIHWMKTEAAKLGLKPVDVLLVSAHKGEGMDEALQAIDQIRRGKDVFVVGCTNVGKSTFINRIIKSATGIGEVITTSHFPGTTLDLVEIPLDDGQAIFDTPGIINDHQIAHHLEPQDLKAITPKKELKPKVFQLNAEQTLFIGGLARFDFLSGDRSSFSIHVSNALPIHRTKLENADALYEKHIGEMLAPPSPQSLEKLPPFVRHEFSIRKAKTDIVISGLGWITIQHPNVVVAVHAPRGVDIVLRPSLI